MRSILVPVADRPECAVALRTAFQLAKRVDGSINGYFVRPHVDEAPRQRRKTTFLTRDYGDWQDFLDERDIAMDSAAARDFFNARVEDHGFTLAKSPRYAKSGGLAIWHEMIGNPDKVMSIVGPLSDLIVVSRPEKHTSVKARSFLLSALMLSNRPVLVLPRRQIPALGERVLIAWNQSAESASAVAAAMPILMRAQNVHILMCGQEHRVGPKPRHLQQYLRFYGVKSTLETRHGKPVTDEIQQCYHATKSNLLVMGAYSRHHWRETVFGGVTQRMMTATALPVFMLHQ